jgi:hypothetical protein
LNDVELDALTFGERLVSAALDRGMVDKQILRPILRRDETESLLIVEPFDGAGLSHVAFSSRRSSRKSRVARDGTQKGLLAIRQAP